MGVIVLNMDLACEASSHVMTPMCPNVCKTPAAPSPLPLPYPNIGNTGSLDPGTEKVKSDDKKTMNLKCKIKRITGNEPGTLKDITSSQTNGHAWCTTGGFTVLFEGAPACITGSMGLSNSA